MRRHERIKSALVDHVLGTDDNVSQRGAKAHLVKYLDEASRRLLDIIGALTIAIVLSPVLMCAAAALYLNGVRPIIFKQERVGVGNRPFIMFKFRTLNTPITKIDTPLAANERAQFMLEVAGLAKPNSQTGLYKEDSHSATGLGRLLRKYSIDELPQLWNVFRGDMSLVGPRPALVWEAELFSPTHQRRHFVKPGMTGLWQVSGRNALSTAEMLFLDLAYVEKRNVWLDLKILLQTPKAVLSAKLTR